MRVSQFFFFMDYVFEYNAVKNLAMSNYVSLLQLRYQKQRLFVYKYNIDRKHCGVSVSEILWYLLMNDLWDRSSQCIG